ncbi:MAG TPA: PIN domain-containing protein [Candidatus Sulfotelmatobacter sp.]|nr:PIN domain-containing protein [Candidatus Sulfotelmatobacter sp.]
MSRIYWDSMLFIYWLDDNPHFAKRVASIHARMSERSDELITSAVTVGEVLAGVYRKGPMSRVDEVRNALVSLLSEVVPFTADTADHYARIRGTLNVGSPDAIHLACAASAGTDLFLTNDKKLLGKIIPGIQFIASLETNLF